MATVKEQTHLSKWGNSHATRIPNKIIKQMHLKDNQTFDISIKDNAIVLTPIEKQPQNIHELFEGWEDDGIREHELDWGKPQGKELPW